MAKQTIYNAGIYVRLSQDTSTLRKETSQAKSNPINNYITKEKAISRECS